MDNQQIQKHIEKGRNIIHLHGIGLDHYSEGLFTHISQSLSIMEKQQREIADKDTEIERLRTALIVERDDALKWDGIGTVNRINAVLSPKEDQTPPTDVPERPYNREWVWVARNPQGEIIRASDIGPEGVAADRERLSEVAKGAAVNERN